MRKTLGVAALMLALCCPALAGEVHIPPAPQPTPASATQAPTTTDEDTHGATDTLTQIVLTVLVSILP
jgi:hypothetical protein